MKKVAGAGKICEGDCVLLVGEHMRFGRAGERITTGFGAVSGEIIGMKYGEELKVGKGEFLIVKATLRDFFRYGMKRGAQIVIPEVGYQVGAMTGWGRDDSVYDVGAGSGGLALVLGRFVGSVVSFEKERRFLEVAKRNVEVWGSENVRIEERDVIADGFPKEMVDGVTIDLKEPHLVVKEAGKVVRTGGWCVCYCTVMEQLLQARKALDEEGFGRIAMKELFLREWKTNPTRPENMQLVHTGWLLAGRKGFSG